MKKKRLVYSCLIMLLLIAASVIGYRTYFSVTRIALVNFPGFTVEKFVRSNNNPWIKIVPTSLADASAIKNSDFALIWMHGNNMSSQEADRLNKIKEDGVPLLTSDSSEKKLSSFTGREKQYLSLLIDNGCTKNYRSFLNYIRTAVDKKHCGNTSYHEPVIIPSDYFFYLGDDNFFSTYEAYQKDYEKTGHYKPGAPRIAILAGNINKQNANEEPTAALINNLEALGNNVYPIFSFGMRKLKMLEQIKPDVILNHPHGRLIMGDAQAGIQILKNLDAPILSPQTVYGNYEDWLTSKQPVGSGGLTTMGVVLPEMDGAIAAYAVSAQFERNGRTLFESIPQHTKKFCHLVNNFIKLRRKKNQEKHVAIYFYKGVGKGNVSAADIEGVQSLYNTLTALRDRGYDVSGLPENADALADMIQKQAPVLGPYALGSYNHYLKNGNPYLVDVDTFRTWAKETLPDSLLLDMKATYGEAPGKYMKVEKENKKFIAVARIQLGNVALLPQPLPAVGEDVNKLVHGVNKSPTYPYVASYLWTRNQFQADAIIHFGTHGSLEFTPGKPITPSGYDWADALIADMPHFYIYAISDIGEGIIAKRKSYATLISHLTPPFMRSDLYDQLEILKNTIHKMETLAEGAVKQNYRKKISLLAKQQRITQILQLDSTRTLQTEEIEHVHRYLEEINQAKVNQGLYTLGKHYSEKQLTNTVRMMSVDPIRYALADLDVVAGKVKRGQLSDIVFMSHRYDSKTYRIINRALGAADADAIFNSLVSKKELKMLADYNQKIAMKRAMRKKMMAMMLGNQKQAKLDKYLDANGQIIESIAEETPKHAEMPKGMAKGMAKGMSTKMPTKMKAMNAAKLVSAEHTATTDAERQQAKRQQHIDALASLKATIKQIAITKQMLYESTISEQEGLANALDGKYIPAGTAGDPIINPNSIPTGRNFYGVNPEITPSDAAWIAGKRLANQLLAHEMKTKNKYPEKVSFTLWSSDFINTEGATIGEILYLLGVEPMRDGFGYVRSLRLIPADELNRPRVDVVVQTSGQLRDIAASRLKLINDAIIMAGTATDGIDDNYVHKGFEDAEKKLLAQGFSPVDARKYARQRIFGGINNSYGTGIIGAVMQGDKWENRSELAKKYLHNMSALYTDNGGKAWGEVREGVFEAALLNTDVVVQPLSSNTWGALSLDHVFEFMGGMSAAVEQVTGKDPTGYFNDYRNGAQSSVKELRETIGVESSSTVLNPKYIKGMLAGEASALNGLADIVTNTYGWNSLKPSAIDKELWNRYYEVYVKDQYHLNIPAIFDKKNPYALQEMTAVMLETARKGMWDASAEQLKTVAKLHTTLIAKHGASGSGFVSNNSKLQKFISSKLNAVDAKQYQSANDKIRQVQMTSKEKKKSVVLKKESSKNDKQVQRQVDANTQPKSYTTLYVIGAIILIGIIWIMVHRRKQD